MGDDLRIALRSLRSSKNFTIPALVVLTLGIGATTAIFSVVDAVVLRGLPFQEHDRLVAVGERRPPIANAPPLANPDTLGYVAPQNYMDWAAQQDVFESMAAIASGWLTLQQPGAEPESLVPQRVTADFFRVLRVRPAIGRAFTPQNELPGRDRVAVLSDGLWRRRFGADPQIVGRTIALEDIEGGKGAYEVVGVMPADFSYPVGAARATDIWIPYAVPGDQRTRNPASRSNYLQVIARLRTGVDVARAQARMDQIALAIEQANPIWNKDNRIGVRPLIDHVVGSRTKSWMLMLLGAVAVVLLIACANVGNLLLARAAGREREVSVRAALGARRWRLIRAALAESVVLALIGTVCAIVAAFWIVQLLRASIPDDIPRVTTIAVNVRVLIAASALTLATALLFGLVPALQVSNPDLSRCLREGGRETANRGRRRIRAVLLVVELALALVLLVGAALFIGSFAAVMRIDPGFRADGVLTAQISPPYGSRSVVVGPEDRGPAFMRIVDRLREDPGVSSVAMIAGGMPLGGASVTTSVTIPGRIDLTANEQVSVRQVTPDYHKVLQIPLRQGRLFDAGDRRDSPGVVILNESAARRYFAGSDPIGQVIGVHGNRVVVGIVGDVHQQSLETDPAPEAYVPMAQALTVGGQLLIRTTRRPQDVLPAARAAVFAILPDVPIRNVITMDGVVGRQLAQRRFNMLLLGLFGILGLAIAAVGIYGVMATIVAQRTREIGVRIALGASQASIMRMVVVQACAMLGTGVAIGAVAAWNLSAAAKAFLFRLQPTDWRAFAASAALLAVTALAASVIPARRAASVDPMIALRAE
jgi:putative ABC transport system permease protein